MAKLKTFFAITVTAVIVIGLIGGFIYIYQDKLSDPSGNVCVNGNPFYTKHCQNVGRTAFTVTHDGQLINHGKITGVVWRPRGQEISSVGTKKRYAPHSSYYYTFQKTKNSDWMESVSSVRVR